ncbi:MAG TPA: DUF1203 domain-containing protein [Phenylobacterium sp.]|nr:DUF1203 domain-containing protein [Phenylobacterium sp.]
MSFQILGLPARPFTPLFDLDAAGLAAIGARRMTAEAPNSAPCRVSLREAEPGEELILCNHAYLPTPGTPYRASGPIFVRVGAVETRPERGEAPQVLTSRLLSARAYDSEGMMSDADVVEGADLALRLTAWLADPAIDEVHIHSARRGCYLARAVR